MEKTPSFTVENLIGNWNDEFPNYPLTAADLKKPQAVMGALLLVFDRLGIDRDAVLSPLPEDSCNESTIYYWDMLPVINMTRIVNHLVSVMPQVATINITHFLQPTVTTSHSILLLLFNLMLFNEERLRDIAPYEEELFSKTEQVKLLEDKKNSLRDMLNSQAEEKAKRAERLEEIDHEIKQLEAELKRENEAHDAEKQELEAIVNENHRTQLLFEHKKTQRDGILSEIEKKRTLRVYDAEDVKSQAEKAAQNLQDAEAELNSLKAVLMQKENNLNNLQTFKPYLDKANDMLHEISDGSRDCDDDLESDSKEGELDVLNTELGELESQLSELKVAREEASQKRQENSARRQQERTLAHSQLHQTEEEDRKRKENCRKASQHIQHIKDLTLTYEQEKEEEMTKIKRIKDSFTNNIMSVESVILKKAKEVMKSTEEKLKHRKN